MTAPSTCPDADTLVQYVDDALVADVRLGVEDHIDGCDDCRSTVSIMARAAVAERRASQPEVATDRDPSLALAATAVEDVSHTDRDPPGQRSPRKVPQSPLAPGTKVGRYVIAETLGIGGMGIVYSARDPDLGRDVAIKILRPELARAHPDAAKRIMREAQAMARIAHPNVVNVFDVGTVDDRVFVAMERVTGTHLRGWLAREDRTPAEIVQVFIDAGRGLIAAHDAGIVHRDFKPDNVLVGADGRPRVTDFGLAYEADDESVDVSAEGAARPIAGTPAYMAPEQHAGGNVDARTDQFAFAVALYEALYGERPFAGKTREAIADAIVHGDVQPPPSSARVPASLRAILLRALSVKPGARFSTLAELLGALGRDRARTPRLVALAALAMLLFVGVAFAADLVMRDRMRAITRTSFASARAQLAKLVALRTDAFVAQSDALYRLPAVEEVAASYDQNDFGLGDPNDDRRRLEHIHENLASADWVALTHTHKGDFFAIGDQKGRLLFGSSRADVWGGAMSAVPAIDAAYNASDDTSIDVIEGDNPAVVASGLLGGTPRPGLYVMFTRTKRIGPRPRAMFVQAVDAARLLEEVGLGEDTHMSIVASSGRSEGDVPPHIVQRASGDGIATISYDGEEWLGERTPLRTGDQREAFAQIVLARASDVGLAGLFPEARTVFAALGLACAAIAFAGSVLANRRNLSR
jgi:protein kinase-like protein